MRGKSKDLMATAQAVLAGHGRVLIRLLPQVYIPEDRRYVGCQAQVLEIMGLKALRDAVKGLAKW